MKSAFRSCLLIVLDVHRSFIFHSFYVPISVIGRNVTVIAGAIELFPNNKKFNNTAIEWQSK